MVEITISDNALEKLRTLMNQNEEFPFVRVREYATGTACCRKVFLSLTFDELEDEDVEFVSNQIPFVIEEDLVDQYGTKYNLTLSGCEQKSFIVTAER